MGSNPAHLMSDLIYIAVTAGFFALAVCYARFCGNL
jgi:hypothetical protein